MSQLLLIVLAVLMVGVICSTLVFLGVALRSLLKHTRLLTDKYLLADTAQKDQATARQYVAAMSRPPSPEDLPAGPQVPLDLVDQANPPAADELPAWTPQSTAVSLGSSPFATLASPAPEEPPV